jgi:hypothetical protein
MKLTSFYYPDHFEHLEWLPSWHIGCYGQALFVDVTPAFLHFERNRIKFHWYMWSYWPAHDLTRGEL